MDSSEWVQKVGLVSSIVLPFFNIPLMMRMVQRRSSQDLSLTWLLGVLFCLVGMLPAGLKSPDSIFQIFSVINLAFFTGVTALAIYFRWRS